MTEVAVVRLVERLTVSIVGLWAGAVYEPTAIIFLSRQAGMAPPEAAQMASHGTGLLSIGTIPGCIAAPGPTERPGRRSTLALYYFGMMVTIALAFGWACPVIGLAASSHCFAV